MGPLFRPTISCLAWTLGVSRRVVRTRSARGRVFLFDCHLRCVLVIPVVSFHDGLCRERRGSLRPHLYFCGLLEPSSLAYTSRLVPPQDASFRRALLTVASAPESSAPTRARTAH